MGDLRAVPTPDLADISRRFTDLQRAHRNWARITWIGTLVTQFTNDELRLWADRLSIEDTLALRNLGLLGPDEGYDGRKKKRKKPPSGLKNAGTGGTT